MPNIGVFSLADILEKNDRARAQQQAMMFQQAQMQDYMQKRAEQKTLGDIYAKSVTTTPGTPAVPFQTTEEQAFGMNPLQGNIAQEATPGRTDFDYNKAFQLASQGGISGNVLQQLHAARQAEEDRRLKMQIAINNSENNTDYKDIKITEDGRLIGRRKGTDQYEYMNMPNGAVASQPPVLIDTGTGVVPMTRGDVTRAARGGKKITKEREIPQPVMAAIRDNEINITKAQDILDATDPNASKETIERLRSKGIEHDPEAFGAKTFTPNILLNRIDPKGMAVRGIAGDLASMVIHDRSGAAVTAAEFPRLRPFIPVDGDDKATVRKKIMGFLRTYKQIQSEINQDYSPERGYIPRTRDQGPDVSIDDILKKY